jgi:formylglycine-generating enzyme required for sulfatase activity
MNLKSENKIFSFMSVALILCMTSSLLFCQILFKGVPRFKIDANCKVHEVTAIVETISDKAGKNIPFEMVFVKGDTFWMGAQKSDKNGQNYDSDANSDGREDTVHQVILSDYYIGKTEVTQELWFTVMNGKYENQTTEPGCDPNTDYGRGANYPAYSVSWEDIVGKDAGRASYTVDGITYYADGFCYRLSVLVNEASGGSGLGRRRFSLPTEAEWEYAARGGNKSQSKQNKGNSDYKYSGSDKIDSVAWYWDANNVESTREVGKKLANELGIYDMSGNVWEWCADAWTDKYGSATVTNPINAGTSGSSRVCRGGGWEAEAGGCRVSIRDSGSAGGSSSVVGFRVRCCS